MLARAGGLVVLAGDLAEVAGANPRRLDVVVVPGADEVFSILEPVEIDYAVKGRAWDVVQSGATGGAPLGGLRSVGVPDAVLAAIAEVAWGALSAAAPPAGAARPSVPAPHRRRRRALARGHVAGWLNTVALSGPVAPIFAYNMFMVERRLRGESVTDEQIQAWADEAEAGYDVGSLPPPKRGRPPIGAGRSTVVTVRLDAATMNAMTERARAEGITTRSEAVRAAVRYWANVA
ncbi:ribbon-helix-helix protein, CopG family [Actinomyces timonensis]|uniref:Ribbon-helix-helix protein, CopG family n=1 Tax=Actinomyces timonensis TaxID=1288391 RepID=A0AAU8MX68_9ACTO